jgi:glyoxylase-like metal-dependent hydrolase (beta-lactamase superfamily II)
VRKLISILCGAILLGLVYVATQLAVAHYHIRQVNPPIPRISSLQSVLRTPDAPIRFRYINTASQTGAGPATMGFPAFIFEWSDGRSFLIDVGMDREGALAFGNLIELILGADPIEPHGSIGAQLRDDAREVQGVAFTHLHMDHTGGADTLCEAAGHGVSLFQTPTQTEMGNFGTKAGSDDLAQAGCLRPVEMEAVGESIYRIPGFPGLIAVAAGGHTPGSTIFLAKTQGRMWVLSGDITNFKESISENRPKSWAYSTFVTPESRDRLETLRLWLAELDEDPQFSVVVSHDLDALEATGINR